MKKLHTLAALLAAAIITPCTADALTITANNSDMTVKLYISTGGKSTIVDVPSSLINSGADIFSKITIPSSVDLSYKYTYLYLKCTVDRTAQLIRGYSYLGEYTDFLQPEAYNATSTHDIHLDKEKLNAEVSIDNAYLDDLRTAHFTINIDNPSVFYHIGRSFASVESLPVSAGSNVIAFMPNFENKIYLFFKEEFYSGCVYSVTKNGERLPRYSGAFRFTVEDGDVIDVVTQFPNEMHEVRFVEAEGCEGIINKVEANTPHEGTFTVDDHSSFSVLAGSTLSPSGNYTDFSDITYTIDGHTLEPDFFRYSRIPVDRNPLEIVVSGTRLGTTAIGTIEAEEDVTPVYYNLQGIRVNNPISGSTVIVVRGNKVTKELVR